MSKFWKTYERFLRALGFDKFGNFVAIIDHNGGVVNSAYKLWRFDTLKKGELVGMDEFGNKYYHNKNYFICRSRWVEHADYFGLNYDATHIPPQWHGWLHYKTDYLPHEDPHRPNYPWSLQASENLTGTTDAYMAYSTTKPKIQLWKPKSKST
ncbi:probable NADH dehydrogenase [ubiquinone] 1 alpha subcomplex subunit 12 [Planococcus citri]|uniref:probable NADH dehydrogenase [ubiquinone] 1 alpha subcomplex subunit 12 n=1 Tax=Planococcus citri TaxID=170843 RepID=UPI0031FA2F3D